MARQINLIPSKTYKTLANMERAIAHVPEVDHNNDLFRYIVCQTDEGRYYPIFIGRNSIDLSHAGFCVAS